MMSSLGLLQPAHSEYIPSMLIVVVVNPSRPGFDYLPYLVDKRLKVYFPSDFYKISRSSLGGLLHCFLLHASIHFCMVVFECVAVIAVVIIISDPVVPFQSPMGHSVAYNRAEVLPLTCYDAKETSPRGFLAMTEQLAIFLRRQTLRVYRILLIVNLQTIDQAPELPS
jgi:hypothetical protein